MRVQYARTYDELRALFVKNEIDIWQTMDEVGDQLDALGIECDGRAITLRAEDDERGSVFWRHLVEAMRTEELDAKDRLASTPFLAVGRRAASIISDMTGMSVRPFAPENDSKALLDDGGFAERAAKAASDAQIVDAYVLWGDTGLPWELLPQPVTMRREEFNTYVANIKAAWGEQC